MVKINYVSHSIANNFGEVIEINKHLLKYPELHKTILEHELGHTDVAGFTKHDFKHDVQEINVDQFQLLKFMVLHPKSFMQFLPFYYSKTWGFIYDINRIVIYSIVIMLIVAGIVIGMLI
jgi:hypothetical protein